MVTPPWYLIWLGRPFLVFILKGWPRPGISPLKGNAALVLHLEEIAPSWYLTLRGGPAPVFSF